jgi:hypothetical protein
MIIARIEKPIGPFETADAAWKFVRTGKIVGMGSVEELDAFMKRVDDSRDVITRDDATLGPYGRCDAWTDNNTTPGLKHDAGRWRDAGPMQGLHSHHHGAGPTALPAHSTWQRPTAAALGRA